MTSDTEQASDRPAVDAAQRASEAWGEAVRLQRWADHPRHAEFYALAGEMVDTMRELSDLVSILRAQVREYGTTEGIYDDTRTVEPSTRLAYADDALDTLGHALTMADRAGNEFWSAIGHIGVEDAP
jgi:hypothetical protein